MPPKLDFSNLHDGIDWSRALPPHIIPAAPEAPVVAQAERTLIFDWPLPENHPALQRSPHSLTTVRRGGRATPPSTTTRRRVAPSSELRDEIATGGPTSSPAAPPSQRSAAQVTPSARHAVAPAVGSGEGDSRSTGVAREASPSGWELNDFSYEALLELGSLAVSTGLSAKQLRRYHAVPHLGESTECSICLELVLHKAPSVCLPCHHAFHQCCILRWLSHSNRCPTCRFEVRRL